MRSWLRGVRSFLYQEGGLFKNLFEFLFFLYKRNNWMLDFSRFFSSFDRVEIKKPVFLLGFEKGGLTLVSRTVRRHKDFVSVSGNCKYWAGADEIQLVLNLILPSEFLGRRRALPEKLRRLGIAGNRLYASDEFISYYRKTKEDVTPEIRERFRKIIRWQINRHAIDKKTARFIDKSQVFTVKVSFINEILKDTNPKFILITRNPYALAYKFSRTNIKNYVTKIGGTHKQAVEIAAQHWINSMKCAIQDGQEADLLVVRFEDFLQYPEKELKKICNFIEIDFNKDLLPQPNHKLPFGSKGKDKWYPIRKDVNEKYLNKIAKEEVEIIDKYVGEYARKLGYEKPIIK